MTHRLLLASITSLVLSAGLASAAPATPAKDAPPSFETAIKGLAQVPGFVEVYRDPAKGRVLIGVSALRAPFLLYSSLPWGVGSNDIGLDRGQVGDSRLVEFRRIGNKLLLVQLNPRFTASAADPAERLSVQQAFAESVLWAGEVIAERAISGTLLVDFTSFLTGDRHGVARRLDDAKQGKYALDAARSMALTDDAKSFPDNAEFEALLTFAGSGPGRDAPGWIHDVAVDAESISVRQHLSLVRLPPAGFATRPYHPYSGGWDEAAFDFSKPLTASLDTRVQRRHRLERVDPAAAKGPVKEPIVYYLDPGTPEPVRSALLDGARWWAAAFEAAGFEDAFKVELMPPGMDPMDVRYNVIVWAHRATRGWSYGSSIVDPRTGEIIKGVVTLGSQRVRQDILIGEALTAPYAKDNLKDGVPSDAAVQMALARLRQLSAHEVGHTLGFEHNFAASWTGNGSVMDYPHPLLKIKNSKVDLSDAYGVGVGPWDMYIVKHAYLQVAAADEAAALAALRAEARTAGLKFVGDADSRAASSAHPDGQLWDYGGDPLETFETLMAVRRKALDGFSLGVLPPERQVGELEARLVPVYLLHRYQVDALARRLGGARYDYALAGEGLVGTTPVPPKEQKKALKALMTTLSVAELALPEAVLDLMTPPARGYERGREHFGSKQSPLFDPYAAVAAAASLTAGYLFEGERLNRIAWQHARDDDQLGIADLMDAVYEATWQGATPRSAEARDAVRSTVSWAVLDQLIATLDGRKLQPAVVAQVRAELARWQDKLETLREADDDRKAAAAWLELYLTDPVNAPRRPLPTIPPGAPI